MTFQEKLGELKAILDEKGKAYSALSEKVFEARNDKYKNTELEIETHRKLFSAFQNALSNYSDLLARVVKEKISLLKEYDG